MIAEPKQAWVAEERADKQWGWDSWDLGADFAAWESDTCLEAKQAVERHRDKQS